MTAMLSRPLAAISSKACEYSVPAWSTGVSTITLSNDNILFSLFSFLKNAYICALMALCVLFSQGNFNPFFAMGQIVGAFF